MTESRYSAKRRRVLIAAAAGAVALGMAVPASASADSDSASTAASSGDTVRGTAVAEAGGKEKKDKGARTVVCRLPGKPGKLPKHFELPKPGKPGKLPKHFELPEPGKPGKFFHRSKESAEKGNLVVHERPRGHGKVGCAFPAKPGKPCKVVEFKDGPHGKGAHGASSESAKVTESVKPGKSGERSGEHCVIHVPRHGDATTAGTTIGS